MDQAAADLAIQSQLGIDPFAPLPSNPDIGEALANYQKEAAQVAGMLNRSLLDNYHVAFANWAGLVVSGRQKPVNAPVPPSAYEAVKASDGWFYVVRGATPVCDPLPAPLPPPPPAPPATDPNTKTAAGDTHEVGVPFTDADGVQWVKLSRPTPFGTAYWLQRVG